MAPSLYTMLAPVSWASSVATGGSYYIQLFDPNTAIAYTSIGPAVPGQPVSFSGIPNGRYQVFVSAQRTGPFTAIPGADGWYVLAADATGALNLAVQSLTVLPSGPYTPTAIPGEVVLNDLKVTGLTGAVAGGRFVGFTTFGAPISGTFLLNDYVISLASGAIIVCSVAGSPGTWTYPFGIFNVKDFGADATGVADSTAAINAAITAASAVGGGDIFFPAVPAGGSYKTTSTITLAPGLRLRGPTWGQGIIKPTVAVTGAVFEYAPGVLTTGQIEISDLTILGNATTLYGIHLKNTDLCTLRKLQIGQFTNASAKAIWGENLETSTIDQCWVYNIGLYGIHLATPSSNNNIVRGTTFNVNVATMTGLVIDSGITGTVVEGCDFEGASIGISAIVCSGATEVTIIGNFFENFTAAAIVATSGVASNLTIIGNDINVLSTAAAYVALNSAGPNDSIYALNNRLSLLGNGGQATIGFLFGSTTRIFAQGNKSGGAGTGVISIAGVTQSLPDYVFVSGPVVQSSGAAGGLTIQAAGTTSQLIPTLTGGIQITDSANSRSNMLLSDAGDVTFFHSVKAGTRTYSAVVTLTDAATVTLDASGGNTFILTATAGVGATRAIGLPTNPQTGQRIVITFIQDGTGGRALTWNAVFKQTWSDTGNTASKRSSIAFTYDGTNWNQDGAQTTYV